MEVDLAKLREEVTLGLAALVEERQLASDPRDLLAWYELKFRRQ
jgi:hypothetical protein